MINLTDVMILVVIILVLGIIIGWAGKVLWDSAKNDNHERTVYYFDGARWALMRQRRSEDVAKKLHGKTN